MPDQVVKAGRFELVDGQGRTRAVMACDGATGAPTCTFLDAAGATRVIIGLAWNDMPSIQLNAEDGTARVALIVRPENAGMIVVVDEEANKRVITGADAADP